LLQLQQQKQSTSLPDQLQQLEQRIAYTDNKINEKVYALYGLSAEEIKVVEGKYRKADFFRKNPLYDSNFEIPFPNS
jgi:hypothetical protein